MTGISAAIAKRVRSRCYGERGKSTFALQVISNYDPGGELSVEPIFAWARGIWDNALARDIMHDAWWLAVKGSSPGAEACDKVPGAASAAMAAAATVGWSFPSVKSFMNASGDVLDMENVSQANHQACQEGPSRCPGC